MKSISAKYLVSALFVGLCMFAGCGDDSSSAIPVAPVGEVSSSSVAQQPVNPPVGLSSSESIPTSVASSVASSAPSSATSTPASSATEPVNPPVPESSAAEVDLRVLLWRKQGLLLFRILRGRLLLLRTQTVSMTWAMSIRLCPRRARLLL